MGIIFPLVIPTMCQLSNCDEESVLQSSAAILASSLFGNGILLLNFLWRQSVYHCRMFRILELFLFRNESDYFLFVLVISPIAGICILTVFASECDLASHIKSAAVSFRASLHYCYFTCNVIMYCYFPPFLGVLCGPAAVFSDCCSCICVVRSPPGGGGVVPMVCSLDYHGSDHPLYFCDSVVQPGH